MWVVSSLFLLGWNWYDWLVALALLYGVWSGIRNGLMGEVLLLLGVIGMVLVAVNFYDPVGGWLAGISGLTHETANLLSFVVLALVVYIITLSIRQVLHKRMKNKGLASATLENLGGATVGVLRLAAVMAFLTLALCLTRSGFWHQHVGKDSRFGAYVVHQFPAVAKMVEKTLPDKVWFLEDVKRREDPDVPPQ